LKYENIVIEQGIKVIRLIEQKTASFRGETIIPPHPYIERLILKENGAGFIIGYAFNRGIDMVRLFGIKFRKQISSDFTPYQFKHTMLTELANLRVNETLIKFSNGKLPEGTPKHYLKRDLKTLNK